VDDSFSPEWIETQLLSFVLLLHKILFARVLLNLDWSHKNGSTDNFTISRCSYRCQCRSELLLWFVSEYPSLFDSAKLWSRMVSQYPHLTSPLTVATPIQQRARISPLPSCPLSIPLGIRHGQVSHRIVTTTGSIIWWVPIISVRHYAGISRMVVLLPTRHSSIRTLPRCRILARRSIFSNSTSVSSQQSLTGRRLIPCLAPGSALMISETHTPILLLMRQP
jgi:hypothetical protein